MEIKIASDIGAALTAFLAFFLIFEGRITYTTYS